MPPPVRRRCRRWAVLLMAKTVNVQAAKDGGILAGVSDTGRSIRSSMKPVFDQKGLTTTDVPDVRLLFPSTPTFIFSGRKCAAMHSHRTERNTPCETTATVSSASPIIKGRRYSSTKAFARTLMDSAVSGSPRNTLVAAFIDDELSRDRTALCHETPSNAPKLLSRRYGVSMGDEICSLFASEQSPAAVIRARLRSEEKTWVKRMPEAAKYLARC